MKASEMRKCDLCASPCAGKTRDGSTALTFHRIVIELQVLDPGAITRHAGLAMMLGGSEQLAVAMGPNEDLAHPTSRRELVICDPCFEEGRLAQLLEPDTGKDLGVPETEAFLKRAARIR